MQWCTLSPGRFVSTEIFIHTHKNIYVPMRMYVRPQDEIRLSALHSDCMTCSPKNVFHIFRSSSCGIRLHEGHMTTFFVYRIPTAILVSDHTAYPLSNFSVSLASTDTSTWLRRRPRRRSSEPFDFSTRRFRERRGRPHHPLFETENSQSNTPYETWCFIRSIFPPFLDSLVSYLEWQDFNSWSI